MTKSDNLIIGRNAVAELLRYAPDRIEQLIVADSKDPGSKRDQLVQEAENQGIRAKFMRKEALSDLANSDSHQGFLAVLKPRQKLALKSFLQTQAAAERSVILLLDSIFDPHNFGAILRASECFGVDGVVYSKNRGAPVSAVVSKVSVGASEIVPMIEVSNLAQSVETIRDHGYTVIAADAGNGSHDITTCNFPEKVVLVLGSEGEGIQPLLLKKCDFSVKIPMFGRIDSLNVSQAAAVLLYAVRRKNAS